MKKILTVVGTRPNFIKVTQFRKAAEDIGNLEVKIVHTGQHYDEKMSNVFFRQFNMEPDFFLNVKGQSENEQIAKTMMGLEELIQKEYSPDMILVVGDVNATMAGAITANKLGIELGHVESGLRSFDRTMPEEINRVITDEICDHFFITEQSGIDHLREDGKEEEQFHFVGNTMIDTMVAFEADIEKSDILEQLTLQPEGFVLMTIHRPATVDNKEGLERLLDLIKYMSKEWKVVFPIHPRTVKNAEQFGLYEEFKKLEALVLTDPMDYFSFQRLIRDCRFILTDSGGIQEESTFRLKPCLTLRPNTERPSTVELGTNTLIPFEEATVKEYVDAIRDGSYKKGEVPPLWDGKATWRIMDVLRS